MNGKNVKIAKSLLITLNSNLYSNFSKLKFSFVYCMYSIIISLPFTLLKFPFHKRLRNVNITNCQNYNIEHIGFTLCIN